MRIAAIALLSIALASSASAQQDSGATVLATPEGRYEASWLHRWLLNEGYRDLWSTPVRVEVLDLDSFAGGLTVTELGGGQQTRSLRFLGANGVEYAFRSIDKDVSRGIDPNLRRTIAERVLQDQIGSLLPTGALVVASLLEAVDVLHVDPQLVVMSDDARLGEHRAEFAGMLGFIEERPNEGADDVPGFAGAERVTGSDAFFARLEDDPENRIDAPEYLKARFIDFLVGDWDRHPDQWRWAGFEEGDSVRWLPVPRDRDWAFARLDGLLIAAAGIPFPGYLGFSDSYASAFRTSWNGRALDRRLLSEVPRAVYDTVARFVVNRLTDARIQEAVRQLPEAHYSRVGAQLESALRARRDDLPRIAGEFYQLLAEWTDIDVTDADESIEAERLDDGRLRVDVSAAGRSTFARTFLPSETEEVRLYLHGGDDSVTVSGNGPADIVLRVIGGGGDDRLVDETSGDNVVLADDRGDNVIDAAPDTRVDTDPWEEPLPAFNDPPGARPRDWGAWWLSYPSLSFAPDVGLLAGFTAIRYGYAFRRHPWETRLRIDLAVSTGGVVRGGLAWERPLAGRNLFLESRLRASGLEVDRFYGFGNETIKDEEASRADFYHAERRELGVELLARLRPSLRGTLALGTVFRALRSVENENTLIDQLRPFGYGHHEFAGLAFEAAFDARDNRPAATRGVFLSTRAEHYPAVLDAATDWTALDATGSVYLTPPLAFTTTLALRAGARKRWGAFPWMDAAKLGGADDLRGFSTHRFSGHAAAWGNAELRLAVARVFALLPLDIGVFGLADGGRAWADGEESDLWHSAFGGGLSVAVLSPSNAATIAFVDGDEGVRVYVRGGFAF